MIWKSVTSRFVLGLVIASGTIAASPLATDARAQNYAEIPPAISGQDVTKLTRDRSKILKGEGDIRPLLEYYAKFLVPALTQGSLASQQKNVINRYRGEIIADADNAAKYKAVVKDYNRGVIMLLQPVVENKPLKALKADDKNLPEGEEYYPATRINAMAILLALNEAPAAGQTPPLPERTLQKFFSDLVKTPTLDAITYMALQGMQRQLRYDAATIKSDDTSKQRHVSEAGRAAFVQSIEGLLSTEKPAFRTDPAHEKLKEQCLVTLTLLASTSPADAPSVTKATELVSKLIQEVLLDENASEWIKETACRSLGTVNMNKLPDEQLEKLYIAFAKYGIKSIKDWRVKVVSSSGLAASGGYGSSGPGGGYGNAPGSGYGSAPGGAGYGSGTGSMGSGESGYGGLGGMGGAASQPRQSQPVEVKNARRLAHQRFEALHLAVNGKSKNWPANHPMSKVQTKELGLAMLLKDNEKQAGLLKELIEKLELCQDELGDEKLMSLTELTNKIRKPIAELRVAFELFAGEREVEAVGEGIDLTP